MTNFDQKLAALEAALPDLLDAGAWLVEAVETADTLADFVEASNHWAECSAKMLHGEVAGLMFVAWPKVQVSKGEPRRALTVIDFGDRRVAIDDYAGDWDLIWTEV